MTIFSTFTLSLILLGSGTLALAAGGGKLPALHPKMEQECSDCHTAFQPNFLPSSSWTQVMDSLDQHFGADAAQVEKWFKRNCNDALGRVCTTQEKGNFVSYMLSV